MEFDSQGTLYAVTAVTLPVPPGQWDSEISVVIYMLNWNGHDCALTIQALRHDWCFKNVDLIYQLM